MSTIQKRRYIHIATKLKIIDSSKRFKPEEIAKHFDLPGGTIRTILQHKASILEAANGGRNLERSRIARKGKYDELNNALLDWVKVARAQGESITEASYKDVRFSIRIVDLHSKQNELNAAIGNFRPPSAEQDLPNDSKLPLPQIFASLGAMLKDTGNGATESQVTSTEIKQECYDFESHESTYNDDIGTTNEALIHCIKAESGSSHEDDQTPIWNVNGQENTEEIDSQIPSVSSTELTSVVKTEQNDPATNSEFDCTSKSMSIIKAEPDENVSTMPVGLRLEAALSSYVPIDVDANEGQHNSVAITTGRTPGISRRKRSNFLVEWSARQSVMDELYPNIYEYNETQHNPVITKGRAPRISLKKRPSPERRYPKRSAWKSIAPDSSTESDEYDEDEYIPAPKKTSNKPSISRKKQSENEWEYASSDSDDEDEQIDSDEYDEDEYTPVPKRTSHKPSVSRNKRMRNELDSDFQFEKNSVASSRQSSSPTRKSTRELLKLLPAMDVSTLLGQHSSKVNQSTVNNFNGDKNENDGFQNPTTSGQVPLDAPTEPAQKRKITKIFINIYNGTAEFETSDGEKCRNRPLDEYVSILRKSEADETGCDAYIYFYFRSLGSDPPKDAQKTLNKLSREIRSIAHLWANGRVTAELNDYLKYENDLLPLSDFCTELFGQDRSILECKILYISIWSPDWPLSVVTNAARRCSALMLKEMRGRDQPLHYRLLDILYEGKLPNDIEITLDLYLNKSKAEFIDELKKRFQSSTKQNFKITLRCWKSAPPDMLLRNEHGSTLTMETLPRLVENQRCVMIEQRTDS
ncbi:hypothetical protein Ddc_21333 [Ditylenchus destructor]|nr:hypothetical protein Ddc_21333 [Ditylenchus destructor]